MRNIDYFSLLLVIGMALLSTAAPKTVVLQQGLDGYNGCIDNELRSHERNYDDGPVEAKLTISEL